MRVMMGVLVAGGLAACTGADTVVEGDLANYAQREHDHAGVYAPMAHGHTEYANRNHTHEPVAHDHDDRYLPVGHEASGPGVAKAWVAFDGSGKDVVVNKAYNVDSVVRVSPGRYRITWATPFEDANYLVTGACNMLGTGGTKFGIEGNNVGGEYHTFHADAMEVGCRDYANYNEDADLVHVLAYSL